MNIRKLDAAIKSAADNSTPVIGLPEHSDKPAATSQP